MDGSNVNVDDLFDEEDLEQAALNIPLPSNDVVEPAVHDVPLEFKIRLDELHRNGCRQRVSWSRLGCVASISSDSESVGVQCLRLKRQTATWELSANYSLEFSADDATARSWTHLCWSGTGNDLAIFDTKGRVSIFAMSTASAVNRFQDLNVPNPDHRDELSQTVGTFWLPVSDRESPAISQMSKQDEQWALVMTKKKPMGPVWQRALLFVTRTGTLRLLYMKVDRTWSEADAILSAPSKPQDLLTHAAFAPTANDSVHITTHSTSGKFSIYSVRVNRPPLPPDQMTTIPITLNVEHIHSDVHDQLMTNTIANGDLMDGNSSENRKIAYLSHLEIVPTTDIEKAVQIPPTIFAINTISSSIPGVHNSLQAKSSIIHRWSLHTVSQILHSRFDEIPIKGATSTHATSKSIKTIQRLPSIPFDGIITSFHLVESSAALAITTADGTTSFYSSNTMSPIFYESSTQEVTSLSQAGFVFPPTDNPFDICFSPNACCAVSLAPSTVASTTEAKSLLTIMSHHSGLQDSIDSNLDSALASLILTYSRACYNGSSSDDLLTCILNTVRPAHIPQLCEMVLSTLFRNGDFIRHGEPGSEIDKLPQKLLVPKCLSLFAALGVTASPSVRPAKSFIRTTAARYAWLTLHIRHVTMQLVFFVNNAKGRERLPPEIVFMTSASIVWAMSLCRWMVDELCAIDDGEDEAQEGNRELVSLTLGGSWSRYFLKMTERVLRMFSSPPTGIVGEVVRAVREQQGCGLTLVGLGMLLDAAERFSGETGSGEERELIAAGENTRAGFLEKIVKEVLPEMRRSGDVDKLAVYASGMKQPLNWTLLEVGNVDIHKKKFKGRVEVRRCVRCASISEDIGGPKREWPKWIQQQMSRCVCEASFWIEEFDD